MVFALRSKSVPQRLKPSLGRCVYGTAEAAPFVRLCGRGEKHILNAEPQISFRLLRTG
jgi:hypothetical protein